MEYESVIGLEVHAQLLTESKLFCSSSTEFGGEPNSQGSPVSLGLPGALPVLNKKALEFAIRAALSVNCEIAHISTFARKHYFYPDLPKGYQISQYDKPLSLRGWLEVEVNGSTKRIGITRIHMEEDAGKLLHENSPKSSFVDLNRAGVPLIEIVSEPDIRTSDEAVAYMKKLRAILMYIGVCDGNMEEGSFRCDANISIRPKGSNELGTKAEIKNVNSFKYVQKAIEYEIKRQIAIVEGGGEIVQETRLFDSNKGITSSMRSKEEAHDYRYFPDPDLLPVVVEPELIEEIKKSIPELPEERKNRFVEQFALPSYDAELLTSLKSIADYFESCLEHYNNPKVVSNWVMNSVLKELKGEEGGVEKFSVTPKKLSDLLNLIDDGTISANIAKDVFAEMAETGKSADEIVSQKGMKQITDTSELESIIAGLVEKHQDEAERYKAGEKKLIGFFMGQVMKQTSGKANPKVVNQLLAKMLG